ncbi:MAG: hypothetical protein KKD14_01290 [Verrucomicrobia bacterium]|nr:hypothetical protein [Verrucomicrobiota bacterium]MCG2680602.1 hypothetical protein [Kiritimatiellia bacterium]
MFIETKPEKKIKPGPPPTAEELQAASAALAKTKQALQGAENAIAKAVESENTELLIKNNASKQILTAKQSREAAALHDLRVFDFIGKMSAAGAAYREAKTGQHLGKDDLRTFLERKLDKGAAKQLANDPTYWPQDIRNWRAQRCQALVDHTNLFRELKKFDPTAIAKYILPGT